MKNITLKKIKFTHLKPPTKILWILSFVVLSSITRADTFYVSNSGNDSNLGTELEPWKTIQHAANTLEAGETVIIKSGTYEEYVKLKNSGSPGKYISFIGEERNEVVMFGNKNLKSAFESSESSYIRIESITILNYHQEGIGFNNDGTTKNNIRLKNLIVNSSGFQRGTNCPQEGMECPEPDLSEDGEVIDNNVWDHGIRMANVDNFIIDQCNVLNSWGNNIHIHECKNGAVINSSANGLEADDIGEEPTVRDDSDGISIQNSERIVVRNCEASFNGEDGIDVGGYAQDGRVSRDIKHIRITNCIAKNNSDDGLCNNVTRVNAHGGEDVTFANNLSVGNRSYGITCYSNSVDVKLVHNTVANNKWTLHLRDNPRNFKIKNNIFSFSNISNLDPNDTDPEELEISNNNWFNDLPSEEYRGVNPQNENPAFALGYTYLLSDDSPCIDFGTDLTKTTNSGNNTNIIEVEHSGYFCDGFGVVSGDMIDVAGQQVEILKIFDEYTIKVRGEISWEEGDPVNFVFSGDAPDLGWKEYTSPVDETGLLGDVNCDGEVTAVDALFILQYVVGLRGDAYTCDNYESADETIYIPNADVNDNGGVDAVDALKILQCVVGAPSYDLCPN